MKKIKLFLILIFGNLFLLFMTNHMIIITNDLVKNEKNKIEKIYKINTFLEKLYTKDHFYIYDYFSVRYIKRIDHNKKNMDKEELEMHVIKVAMLPIVMIIQIVVTISMFFNIIKYGSLEEPPKNKEH